MQALGGRRLAAALLRCRFSSQSILGQTSASGKSPLPPLPSAALSSPHAINDESDVIRAVEEDNRREKAFSDSWSRRLKDTTALLKQVRNPGSRGSLLTEAEKDEMWRLHKEDPVTFSVDRLARDFRVVRQRVHCILWLKELEESGKPGLVDPVEVLLETYPEFFFADHKEFHVANLPHKPDFKVMPEDWDGTTRDEDEVHYEISMKEDQLMYEEFLQRFEFNKKKMAGEVKCHKYSRRRPTEGWKLTVEKLGPEGKRGFGGGWKYVSLPDGSSRPLNETERMFLRRETPRRRRRMKPF